MFPAGAASAPHIKWAPGRDVSLGPRPLPRVPSLFHTCLRLLVQHVDAIVSLWGLPDVVKVALAAGVAAERRMTPEVRIIRVKFLIKGY